MTTIQIAQYFKNKGKRANIVKIASDFGTTRQTLINWQTKAPAVVDTLLAVKKSNPEVNILKALNEWQKAPEVLRFIREFMVRYSCEFEEIVKEKN
jgi:hypothetical protein